MDKGYFVRLMEQTQNRMWVNNPTIEEAGLAIAAGAINCTTNPTYAMKMLTSKSDSKNAFESLKETVEFAKDTDEAAKIIQRKLVQKLMREFFSFI